MKNTLKILVIGAILGTALIGCSPSEEGNTPPTNDAAGKNTSSNMGTPATDGTTANTPAANTPAANEPAANTPAANTPAANTPADTNKPAEDKK